MQMKYSLDKIMQSEKYYEMMKFTIDTKITLSFPATLHLPIEILGQYLGEESNRLQYNLLADEFMFWYKFNVAETEMIIIPKHNYEMLKKIGDPAKKFIEYYTNKKELYLKQTPVLTYIIKGIPKAFRRYESTIQFKAENEMYITLKRTFKHHNPNNF